MSDFSIFLEQLIRENGYSIYGFAQEAGVDRPTLHRVLKGQLTPSTSFFQKIVKTLRLFPQEREQLTQNYNILKNGESVFRQRIYIKERLEHLNDFAACRPQLSGDAVAAGENGLPTEAAGDFYQYTGRPLLCGKSSSATLSGTGGAAGNPPFDPVS